MQSMSMNWTTVGTVHMTLMKMMSFSDSSGMDVPPVSL